MSIAYSWPEMFEHYKSYNDIFAVQFCKKLYWQLHTYQTLLELEAIVNGARYVTIKN